MPTPGLAIHGDARVPVRRSSGGPRTRAGVRARRGEAEGGRATYLGRVILSHGAIDRGVDPPMNGVAGHARNRGRPARRDPNRLGDHERERKGEAAVEGGDGAGVRSWRDYDRERGAISGLGTI